MKRKCYGVNPTLSTISTTSFSQSITDKNNEANKTMKEDKQNANIKQPESPSTTELENSSPKEDKIANTGSVSKLSIIAILLTVGLGGFMYYHGHNQATLQNQTINQLQTQLSELKQTIKQSVAQDLQQKISEEIVKQNQQFSSLEQRIDNTLNEQKGLQQKLENQVNDSTKMTQQSLHNLNERLSALSTSENSIWLISQANYLVHLAGRKIWNDQDFTTARLLLKSADESLAQADDSSLLPAREAITKDIASLEQINTIDTDGLVLNLMGLSDSLTDLPLVGKNKSDANKSTADEANLSSPSTPDNQSDQNHPVSNSVSDWSDNILKSTESFLEKFIRIEKIEKNDSYSQCMNQAAQDENQVVKCEILKTPITLDQIIYLRENIRFRLLIAAQAIPRHQESIYLGALQDATKWAKAYFDINDASVKHFLSELEKLQQQSISVKHVPEKLFSSNELEKLMQSRVRMMMTK